MPQTRRSIQTALSHWIGLSPVDGSFLPSPGHPKTWPCSLARFGLARQKQSAEEARGHNYREKAPRQGPGLQRPAAPNKAHWSLGRPSPLPPALGCPALRRLQLPGYPPGAQVAGRGRGALPAVTKCLIEAVGASRSLGRARTPYRAGLMQSEAAAIQLASN